MESMPPMSIAFLGRKAHQGRSSLHFPRKGCTLSSGIEPTTIAISPSRPHTTRLPASKSHFSRQHGPTPAPAPSRYPPLARSSGSRSTYATRLPPPHPHSASPLLPLLHIVPTRVRSKMDKGRRANENESALGISALRSWPLGCTRRLSRSHLHPHRHPDKSPPPSHYPTPTSYIATSPRRSRADRCMYFGVAAATRPPHRRLNRIGIGTHSDLGTTRTYLIEFDRASQHRMGERKIRYDKEERRGSK
ncbi:hypothetical protein K438DRAFT_1288202 [Mycena galopus ATCC 62051]|nr:hypothetical protein K438DRAFT_1288202 [Mycena galopus ATCC 62051]